MQVDIGNALSSVATPGVPRTSLEHLDEAVGSTHERIERGRTNGDHGYAALNLPLTADPESIKTRPTRSSTLAGSSRSSEHVLGPSVVE